jgi:hypothetical protein
VTELDEDTVVAAVVVVVVVVVCEGGAKQPSGSRDKALEPRQPLESPNPLGERYGGGEVWWEGGRIGHFRSPSL